MLSAIYIITPILVLGLFWYLLFWKFPNMLKGKLSALRPGKSAEADNADAPSEDEIEAHVRRRPLVADSPASENSDEENDQEPEAVAEEADAEPESGAQEQPPIAAEPPKAEITAPEPEGEIPLSVDETVSVILKRQIPPRFDDAPRSWLGGLPMMPEGTEWPRSVSSEYPDRGERPLHFVAQICCEDLPGDLWGGIGPRSGWLLLFLDPNIGTPDDASAFHVLHTSELGTESEAPFDLGPVHDGVYTGPSYAGEAPDTWQRWPVDLVTVANDAREEEGRVLVAPDDFANILYDGDEVAKNGARITPPRPFTFGQAATALEELAKSLEKPTQSGLLPDHVLKHLDEGGTLESINEQINRDLSKFEFNKNEAMQNVSESDLAEAEKIRANYDRPIANLQRHKAWISEMESLESLQAYAARSVSLEKKWADKLRKHIGQIGLALAEHEPEAPLDAEQWDELTATFADHRFSRFTLDRNYRDEDDQPALMVRETTRNALLKAPPILTEELAARYLDPELHATIPDDIREAYEPVWRTLYSNRPHRMGGFHDGLQSDAVIGPSKDLLLFQIASDDAMNWCWGDAGAYYFWIKPKHLKQGDFSCVEMHLECH